MRSRTGRFSSTELSFFRAASYKPIKLNSKLVREIGIKYWQNHPKTSDSCLDEILIKIDGWFHNNHDRADELLGFNPAPENDTPEACLVFLKDIYKRLPNNNGDIASDILEIYRNYFKDRLPTQRIIMSARKTHVLPHTVDQVVARMEKLIQNRFGNEDHRLTTIRKDV